MVWGQLNITKKSIKYISSLQNFLPGAVYYAVQGGSNLESVNEILKCENLNEIH